MAIIFRFLDAMINSNPKATGAQKLSYKEKHAARVIRIWFFLTDGNNNHSIILFYYKIISTSYSQCPYAGSFK